MSWTKRWSDKWVLRAQTARIVLLVAVVKGFASRRRMSHDFGIAAAGKVRILDDPKIPDNDFFRPGREFHCRVRHADADHWDGAKLSFRGAAVKFADSPLKAPLDLIMNSGPTNPTFTARVFKEFMPGQLEGGGHAWDAFFEKYPESWRACQLSHRRNPESYAKVYYYSQVPVSFHAQDSVKRLVKFRMIPESREPESGLLTKADLDALPSEARLVGETRSPRYLIDEFKHRVETKGVAYLLQMQIHEVAPEDTDEIYNSVKEWDESTHRWIDMAVVRLDRILSPSESRVTTFGVSQRPPCLSSIPAKSVDDYNSVDYLREKSMLARRARLLGYKLFGMPEEVQSEAPRWNIEASVEPTPEQKKRMPGA